MAKNWSSAPPEERAAFGLLPASRFLRRIKDIPRYTLPPRTERD